MMIYEGKNNSTIWEVYIGFHKALKFGYWYTWYDEPIHVIWIGFFAIEWSGKPYNWDYKTFLWEIL